MRLIPALAALVTAGLVAWMATFGGRADALFVQPPPPAAQAS